MFGVGTQLARVSFREQNEESPSTQVRQRNGKSIQNTVDEASWTSRGRDKQGIPEETIDGQSTP